jgi:competence protein ComEC
MKANRMSPPIWMGMFAAGVVGHRFVGVLFPVWMFLLAFALVALIWVISGRRIAIYLIAAIAGFSWANYQGSELLKSTIDSALEGKNLVVEGAVLGVPVSRGRYVQFDFKLRSLELDGKPYPFPNKIRLKSYHDQDAFRANQSWRFTVRLKRARGMQNPGSQFDYETWLFSNRIRATGYVRNVSDNRLLDSRWSVYSISQLRSNIQRFIEQHFDKTPETGILSAILVGLRGNMDESAWKTLRNTGTIHLVAISGLHISLLSGMIIWIIAKLWRLTGVLQNRIPARDAALVAGVLVAIVYSLLAGMTIPTRRALIMLIAIAVTFLWRTRTSVQHTLVFALFIVLAIDPLSPLDNGFWLSFSAVAIIAVLVNSFSTEPVSLKVRVIRFCRQWTVIQLGLGLGMAPLLMIMFNQVSLIAPLANLVAVPVVTITVVPLGMAGLFSWLAGFTDVAIWFMSIAVSIIHRLMDFLGFLGNMDWGVWYSSSKPVGLLVGGVIGLTMLRAGFFRYGIVIAMLWLSPVWLFQPEKPDHGGFRYTMLDVGQGLASVIETRNHVLVYDTGPGTPGGWNSGTTVVVPYLRSRGINSIDTLVVTHEHNDHSGGASGILGAMDVHRFLTGSIQEFNTAEPCHRGQGWVWDGVEFDVLWPKSNNDAMGGNNASCVILIRSGDDSLLLTADIESEVESRLVTDYGDGIQVSVVQIPHHGSRTSSSVGFIQQLDPELAVLSAGYRNRFNHPHQDVMKRYQIRDIRILDTSASGAISLDFPGLNTDLNTGINRGTIVVNQHRDNVTGYWYN